VQIDVVAFGVGEEFGSPFNERYRSSAIIAEEYIQQSPATDDRGQVVVCGAIREVRDEHSALVVNWDTLYRPLVVVVVVIIIICRTIGTGRERLGLAIASDTLERTRMSTGV
jgi:hypothetical protein